MLFPTARKRPKESDYEKVSYPNESACSGGGCDVWPVRLRQPGGAARYARPMPGAADALRELDFTDLDGDGNSELSAGFSFPDGTSASLLWFYTDGGFVYSEEFSVQPGETPPAGAEP